MVAFIRPIPWFLETVRQWRWRIHERPSLAEQLADEAASADSCNEHNISFWYLPPPC